MQKIKKTTKLTILSLLTISFLLATNLSTVYASYTCGGSSNGYTPVKTSIDLGCSGNGNPIVDLTFAMIRILSDGVGVVIIASLVVAGVQYTTSGGDPNVSKKAKNRIISTTTALFIFIFAYALINYVVPGGILK